MRPLLLLDVDGVLAPLGAPEEDELGEVVWVDLPPGRYWLRPAVIARLQALVEVWGAEVWWLTSWYGDAPAHLAPALGLPEWRFCTKREAADLCGWRSGFGWWKEAVALSQLRSGREVIWIDDQIADESPMLLTYGQPGLHVVSPDPERGLTLAELRGIMD